LKAWDFDSLEPRLRQAGAAMGAAEAHGFACGIVSAGVERGEKVWLRELLADVEVPVEQVQSSETAFADLLATAGADMAAEAMDLALCLPGEDARVAVRAAALRDWCRGFLYGFGLGGKSAAGALSAEGREALHDLGEIAAMQAEAAAGEADAGALAELEEFVRVAALLMREDVKGRDE
jgi:yecA family protein